MVAKTKPKNDLAALHEEASRVMSDISRLGTVLADAGESKSKEAKESIDEFVQEELVALKARVADLNSKISEYAVKTDEHIHANPYIYILGALGIGFLLGKTRAPRLQE